MARKYYDALARGYWELYGEEQVSKFTKISGKIPNSVLCLDVGCGDGRITRLLLERCSFVVGVDFSFGMIKRASRAKKRDGVFFVVADAGRLPFRDSCFDFVFSLTILQDIEEKERALSEWGRVGRDKYLFSILKKDKSRDGVLSLFSKFFSGFEFLEGEKDYFLLLV